MTLMVTTASRIMAYSHNEKRHDCKQLIGEGTGSCQAAPRKAKQVHH